MAEDLILNKVASIERCVARAREEFFKSEDFASDFTRQDSVILNIQRACEVAIDLGQYLLKRDRLGIPQSAKDVFSILAQAKLIHADLAEKLKKMVGFRNIAVHDYQTLQLAITIHIVKNHLDDFLEFGSAALGASR